jgi:hypothetical protein
MEFFHFFLSDIQILDRNIRYLSGVNFAECGNIPAAHGTKVQTLNGNVVLDGLYTAHINGTSSDVFHSNKTYSFIPFIPFLDVVESVSLCQSDLSRSVLSHLPLASRILHLELGNSNFRQAGVGNSWVHKGLSGC